MPRTTPHSEETKRKISEANKGRKRTPEQRARISQAVMGNNNGRGNKGKTTSLETKQKLSIAGKGKKSSEETRSKLSKALKGNRNQAGRKHSPETLKKLSESNKGQKRSLEARAKMSKSQMGRPPISEETRAKLALSSAKAVKEGRSGIIYAKKPKYIRKNGKTIRCRSSWEYKVAEYLDSLSGFIWEYELEILATEDEVYLPDFFIFDLSGKLLKIIEVKGWLSEKERMKLDRFQRNLLIPIEIWNQAKLEELGLL